MEDDTSESKKRKDVPTSDQMSQNEIDKQRGFNEEELTVCLKVTKFQVSNKQSGAEFLQRTRSPSSSQ
jgi:hypothetical protein